MYKLVIIGLVSLLMLSCSTYKTAERHLNGKMKKADLSTYTWINPANNDTIEYWDNPESEKPLLVMIHGFGASTKYQFYKQVNTLSEDYRLVLPNLYYFGKTRPGSEKYEVSDQVELVNSLINSLEIDSFSLVGVSYGGLIGIELAQSRPEDIQKLVLFDAPVKYMDSSDIGAVQNFFEVPSIEELFVPEEPEGLKKLLYLATGKKPFIPTSFLKEFHQEAYASTIKEKRSLLASMIGQLEDYQKRTYQLDMPTLLVWGENDRIVPMAKGKLLRDHLGDQCEYYLIENAAHMPNMTKAKEFNRVVCSFLNE